MNGIVTTFGVGHDERVRALWVEMTTRFGVGEPGATSVPHFSYHVAESYDREKLELVLREVAAATAVFHISATGIGIFPSEHPVLYVPVARSLALARLHAALWPRLQAISENSVGYYAPDDWFPHITLGHTDITHANIGPIVAWLNAEDLNWTIPVTNLALLEDTGGSHQEARLQVNFDDF